MLKTVCQNTLPFHSHRDITARFDGGSLTSDAGWLLFGSLDRQHRLCEGFSSCIAESRDRRYIRHDLLKLIRQRVLQIVAGEISRLEANSAQRDLLRLDMDLFPFAPFADRVWALRSNLTSYDAWYVALAEVLDCPLVTIDRKLSRASGPQCEIIVPPRS